MTALLLISHGQVASAILESAQQIMGSCDNIQALCLDIDQSPDVFATYLQDKLRKLANKDVIVMTDIVGGTPANVMLRFWQQYPNVTIIGGMNLPMVLAYMKYSGQDGLTEKLIRAGLDSIVNISEKARLYYSGNSV